MSDYLSEVEYVNLCEGCDSLLLAEDSTLERISIPWLHIIREHPMFLKKYVNLFNGNHSDKIKQSSTDKMCFFLNSLANYRKYFHTKGSFYRSSIDGAYKLDLLFVSHLLNNRDAGKEIDSYFGDLPNQLSKLGFKVGIVLINHSNLGAQKAADKWKNSEIPRFIFSPILPIKTEVAMLSRLREQSQKLKLKASVLDNGFWKEITKGASNQATTRLTQTTYRLGLQIEELIADFKPDTVVTTFEGHAWERIVYSSARRVNSKIQCVGYQHASVFKLQHAIRRNLKPEYNPDVILTAGLIGKEQLKRSNSYKLMQIEVLGSNRGFVRKTQINLANKPNISNECCLVIPEGDLEECKILFEYSIDCARSCPNIRFIWRLHPILSFEKIFKKYPHLPKYPENITVSNKTLNEDIEQSCMVLYRGTTAVIQSIKGGLIPLYLNIPGEMIIDPLYDISQGKVILKTQADFKYFIENISNFVNENQSERIDLLKYCEAYYTNFDVNSLVQIVSREHILT